MSDISKERFEEFAKSLGLKFNDITLLQEALTHRSYLNENRDYKLPHNERLEFLGDAVLELVTTDALFRNFPNRPEGELTAIRASLVNTGSIGDAATKFGANDYLLLSKGEAKDSGRARQYILANSFESIVGAIYLDQGYDAAKRFIDQHIMIKLDRIIKENLWQDGKSLFQERAQENLSITPTYKVLEEVGPDHDKKFLVGVFLRKDKVAEGEGHSKQEAEQAAARAALELKGWS